MNLLITAGNTQAPIDSVRCITNIFTGRTGASLALCALDRGHRVTLLTSHPEAVHSLCSTPLPPERWCQHRYRTFADLQESMANALQGGSFDALIHCAAVSDYLAAGVFSPAVGTAFSTTTAQWSGKPPALTDRAAAKVKSDEPELWLRLVRAPKLIDKVRREWGFKGVVVKFKLEVGVSDEQLLDVAERSRLHSAADLMVANTLEGAAAWAYVGPRAGRYERSARAGLPERLLSAIEEKAQERGHD